MSMSRWFRHYAGMMRDEKLVRVAVKSKQPVERVIWVWGAILESASEINDNGRYEFDPGEAAYFLRCDDADLVSILDGLEGFGRVSGGVVVRWGDRQFSSDSAAERQRRYRAKHANVEVREHDDNRNGDADKTSRDGAVTSQEAETDTELEAATQQPRAWPSDRLIEAASVNGGCHPNLPISIAQILAYLDKGYDLERDVLPVIRAKAKPDIRRWSYFGAIIEANAAERAAIPQKAAPPAEDWAGRMAVWNGNQTWAPSWGPKPGEPKCRVPVSLLNRAA